MVAKRKASAMKVAQPAPKTKVKKQKKPVENSAHVYYFERRGQDGDFNQKKFAKLLEHRCHKAFWDGPSGNKGYRKIKGSF